MLYFLILVFFSNLLFFEELVWVYVKILLASQRRFPKHFFRLDRVTLTRVTPSGRVGYLKRVSNASFIIVTRCSGMPHDQNKDSATFVLIDLCCFHVWQNELINIYLIEFVLWCAIIVKKRLGTADIENINCARDLTGS